MDRLSAKLIHRHPHVFGDEKRLESPNAVLEAWEKRKAAEKARKGESLLNGVPRHLPALLKAERVQSKVARVGFDWPDVDGVTTKLDEEWSEFKQAMASHDAANQKEEIGDVLFTLVNLCRRIGVDPEEALQGATAKFTQRFQAMERSIRDSGRTLDSLTTEAWELAWQAAKKPPAAGA